ncbi:MAG TPA: methyltransferase domain-containing protein [Burkholderiales bacterium]|nr:methyltransferase domain-containing protein [Burkholderiales bacterium]
MSASSAQSDPDRAPFGTHGLTLVDRFGVWLSQRAISKHLPPKAHVDVLELGCGFQAKNLLALQSRIGSAVGVDFRVADAVKRSPRMRFIEGPIETATTQLARNAFDVILFISVLEHLWDPLPVLRGCHEWLRPGGVLLVNVPTWAGKTALEYSAFRLGTSPREELNDHKMYYDKRDLWPLLVRAGFLPENIRLRYHKFRLNLFAVVRKPE